MVVLYLNLQTSLQIYTLLCWVFQPCPMSWRITDNWKFWSEHFLCSRTRQVSPLCKLLWQCHCTHSTITLARHGHAYEIISRSVFITRQLCVEHALAATENHYGKWAAQPWNVFIRNSKVLPLFQKNIIPMFRAAIKCKLWGQREAFGFQHWQQWFVWFGAIHFFSPVSQKDN